VTSVNSLSPLSLSLSRSLCVSPQKRKLETVSLATQCSPATPVAASTEASGPVYAQQNGSVRRPVASLAGRKRKVNCLGTDEVSNAQQTSTPPPPHPHLPPPSWTPVESWLVAKIHSHSTLQ
uniref:Uncharacterized protein n=1 Tax=Callorhinchus milii TaxID=7868 RepID=A0A4W3I238_CALMI